MSALMDVNELSISCSVLRSILLPFHDDSWNSQIFTEQTLLSEKLFQLDFLKEMEYCERILNPRHLGVAM